jgi:hypothetical protein
LKKHNKTFLGELDESEMSCVDNCVAKYMQTQFTVGDVIARDGTVKFAAGDLVPQQN